MNVEDLEITHFFVGLKYAKVTKIAPGMKLTQHVHKFDHDSVLLVGKVIVSVDGYERTVRAPAAIVIHAGKAHEVTALEHSLWACLWDSNGETDPAKVDAAVK